MNEEGYEVPMQEEISLEEPVHHAPEDLPDIDEPELNIRQVP